MSWLIFISFHILAGIGFIYFKGRLPATVKVFTVVFLTMSFLYWGSVILHI
ncbi:hypothetical protein ACTSEZ_15650 [Metabacillus sp. JX24]|uniref:hypothetical protein n=1 Tax=Metabacillus sp. JX24 TaxID=3240759 RepID=UPI00350F9824